MRSLKNMPETVYISVPKFVTISSQTPCATGVIGNLAKIKPAPVNNTIMKTLTTIKPLDISMEEAASPRGKKRRLDHLTWEEKIQRKKLKNRVAAQTSRDRKKARMEEMETEIKILTDKTELLENKCQSLQCINDCLLEKNRKLDQEVESLREQLNALKEKTQNSGNGGDIANNINSNEATKNSTKSILTCIDSESIINGSAAGINLSNELRGNASEIETESNIGSPLEDSCPLPTLQDMLLIDEEFDARKLEELAESLLANISANMETCDRSGDEALAQASSGSERLLGSVVGSQAECLESSENIPDADEAQTNGLESILEDTTTQLSSENIPAISSSVNGSESIAALTETQAASILIDEESCSEITLQPSASPDTVYGTYDSKTNSITIVMDNDSLAVNEAVEEIYLDGEPSYNKPSTNADLCLPLTSPPEVYLNVTDCSLDNTSSKHHYDDDEDTNMDDPIDHFLLPKKHLNNSMLSKSPALSVQSIISDHGYESILGSPTHVSLNDAFHSSDSNDFSWEHSFVELFPSLL